MLNLTAVSYLNTKPLLYGIFTTGLDSELNINLAIPSVCAERLRTGQAEIGLVPVAAIAEIPNAHIVSDYCIGAVGAVKTVCLYSDVPIEAIETVFLDFHSRTSVQLVQVLLREYWQKKVSYKSATEGFEQKIQGTTAAVIIGDRTFGLEKKYRYTYDLAEAWFEHTGLPFVFAVWVSTKPLANDFTNRFNAALAAGIAHIPQLCQLIPPPENSSFSLEDYFTKYISYTLDEPKKQALALFLQKISKNIKTISNKTSILQNIELPLQPQ